MQAKKAPADPNAPKELGKPVTPPTQINRVRFSPDGKVLAAACFDGHVRRWDVTGAEPAELPPTFAFNGWVTSLAFTPKAVVAGKPDVLALVEALADHALALRAAGELPPAARRRKGSKKASARTKR